MSAEKNSRVTMTSRVIVLATPHPRNDVLEVRLKERLSDWSIVRVREKHELTQGLLESLQPLFIFFPHWSWLIPQVIHERFNCVIFHMTDLPFGRGGSPLQNLIVRGYSETKLTALKCESGLDTGPIYLKQPLSLKGTAEEILIRASGLMEQMIVDIVEKRPVPVAQKGEVVEFKRRRPEDGDLAPLQELKQVYDFIRMLDAEGYPRAFLETERLHFEFSSAELSDEVIHATVVIKRKIDV
jgi:methionyl-tRNA formyltransferase